MKKWILVLAALGLVGCNSGDDKGSDDGDKGDDKKETKAEKTLLEGKADGKEVKPSTPSWRPAAPAPCGSSSARSYPATTCPGRSGQDGVRFSADRSQPDGKTVWKIESGSFASGG